MRLYEGREQFENNTAHPGSSMQNAVRAVSRKNDWVTLSATPYGTLLVIVRRRWMYAACRIPPNYLTDTEICTHFLRSLQGRLV